MSAIKRKITVGIFVLLFLILAPIIIFYANGNILGENWSILPTGGIFISSSISGTEFYLNGELKDSTGFFNRDYFLKNLKPGTYTIKIIKPGYNDWINKVEVYANMVVESRVFMLPTDILISDITEDIKSETISGTTTLLVSKPNSDYRLVADLFKDNLSDDTIVSAISSTTDKLIKYELGTENNPIKNGHLSIWKQDNSVYIGWDGSLNSSPKIFCQESKEGTECVKELKVYTFKKILRGLDFFPGEPNVLLVSVGDSIYAIEAENNPNKTPLLIYSGNNPDFLVYKNNLIYIKDDNLFKRVVI